ncbi:MAG: SpaA isopeptide-forming pilin-related protein, partial [Promethearchaeota archaeon]
YGTATYVSGDTDGDNELDVTETWEYTVSGSIAALHVDGEEDPIVNEATATGQDLDGDEVTPGSDTWSTDIFHAYITVCKIVDFDGDLSTTDDQVPYTDGCIIELHRNGEPYDTQTTGPDGCVTWLILEPGNYEVIEKVPDGWTSLTPTSYEVEDLVDDGIYSYTFINFEWFTVSGYKYEYFEGFTDSFDELDFETWNTAAGDDSWSLTPEGWLLCIPQVSFPRILADPTMGFTDYSFEVDAKLISGPGYALIFRAGDLDNFYSFQYDPGWGLRLRLFQFSDFPGGTDVAPAVPYSIDDSWHHLKVVVVGNNIRCYIDSVKVFDVFDETLPVYLDGGIGFRTWGGARAYFDNVQVLPVTDPLNGWTIQLYRDYETVPYATNVTGYGTWPDGYYEFTVKHPGHYTIVETLQDGWSAVKPVYYIPTESGEKVGGYSFDAISGREVRCKDFWNFKWFTITVEKYEDITGNGYDGEDTLLGGWTFYLDNGTTIVSHWDEDEDGYVMIDIKHPGMHTLTEHVQDGWTQTGTESYSFNAESGMVHEPFIFTNFELIDITVCKYEDVYGDESVLVPISGWEITLHEEGGWFETQVTSCCGCYTWEDLGPGVYWVVEEIRPGWTPLNGIQHDFLQAISGEDLSHDFMNFRHFTVTIEKYNDITGDGYSELDDTLLGGWTFLLNGIEYEDSNQDGVVEILVTEPGSYLVEELLEEGWTQTGVEDYAFIAESGVNQGPFRFTNFQWLEISGIKYEYGKDPLEGWIIELWKYNDGISDYEYYGDTITNGDGEYKFIVTDPGMYCIKEALKDKWTELEPELIPSDGDGIEYPLDSDDLVLGYEGILVESGVFQDGFNFVNFKWVEVSGYKYLDIDGTHTSIDNPLDEFIIELHEEGCTSPCDTASTGYEGWDDGYYEFIIIFPGDYYIAEVQQDGWIQTYPEDVHDLGEVISGDIIEDLNFWNIHAWCYITDTSDERVIIDDFRIVFTPDMQTGLDAFKISSTNPGQFYFNLIYHVTEEEGHTIVYELPNGVIPGIWDGDFFKEKGGNPIHAYIWNDLNLNGLVDWADNDDDGQPDELVQIDKSNLDITDNQIFIDGIEPCNKVLITVHICFSPKGERGLSIPDVNQFRNFDYWFTGYVDGVPTTTLLDADGDAKKLKAPAIYGLTLNQNDEDAPVSGAIFRLFDSDGELIKFKMTGDDGTFYFDKLKPDDYLLEIELPLGIILQDDELDTTILLSIQIRLQPSDFIQVSVFISKESSTAETETYNPPSEIPPSSNGVESSGYRIIFHEPRNPSDLSVVYEEGSLPGQVKSDVMAPSQLSTMVLLLSLVSCSMVIVIRSRKAKTRTPYEIPTWEDNFDIRKENL